MSISEEGSVRAPFTTPKRLASRSISWRSVQISTSIPGRTAALITVARSRGSSSKAASTTRISFDARLGAGVSRAYLRVTLSRTRSRL